MSFGEGNLHEQVEKLRAELEAERKKKRYEYVIDGKCESCTERRGYYLDAETIASQQEHIAKLKQKVTDLEGMLGELPPEGKCAMLLVQHVGGEYVWACESYDFASCLLVDSEADTYTGKTLNDMFGRADYADKLAMARELRRMAAELDSEGDVLGVMDAQGERIAELESLVRDMWFKNIGRMDYCGWCVIGCDDEENCELAERMDELGLTEVER